MFETHLYQLYRSSKIVQWKYIPHATGVRWARPLVHSDEIKYIFYDVLILFVIIIG